MTAREARERLDAFLQTVEDAKAAKGRGATPEEVEATRRLFDAWFALDWTESNYQREHTWHAYLLPPPRDRDAEWGELEAKLLEPAPLSRAVVSQLVEHDTTNSEAAGTHRARQAHEDTVNIPS